MELDAVHVMPTHRQSRIDETFTATLQKSPEEGGWASFMALGDGTHKLPIKAAVRKAIGKEAGARVTIRLEQRIG